MSSRTLSRTGILFRRDPWLLFFYALAATQGGHFLEHIAQMIQIHALGIPGPAAHGVVGVLDIEWVHFIWNTAVLAVTLLLAVHYRENRWLAVTLVVAGWHEVEHAYIMGAFLTTGVAGTPGLLATGGALAGRLPLSRPDLHFLYNLVETAPLIMGFFRQVREGRRGVWSSLASAGRRPTAAA
ncbi:MAG: hypothetical protein ACRDJN_14840 [Chloroflexota bacterium]